MNDASQAGIPLPPIPTANAAATNTGGSTNVSITQSTHVKMALSIGFALTLGGVTGGYIVDSRVDAVSQVGEGLKNLEALVGRVDERLKRQDATTLNHDARLGSVESRLGTLETKTTVIERSLDESDRRVRRWDDASDDWYQDFTEWRASRRSNPRTKRKPP